MIPRYSAFAFLTFLLFLSQMALSEETKRTAADLASLPAIAAGIGKSTATSLWEGLPHQSFEKDLLASELKSKKTVTFHDYPFYADTLPISEEDADTVSKIMQDGSSFQKKFGLKACGGFHPDYALQWKVGKETWLALVCLGCHEVKFFGPNKLQLYCDIEGKAYEQLKKVLTHYQKNRPEKGLKERGVNPIAK